MFKSLFVQKIIVYDIEATEIGYCAENQQNTQSMERNVKNRCPLKSESELKSNKHKKRETKNRGNK